MLTNEKVFRFDLIEKENDSQIFPRSIANISKHQVAKFFKVQRKRSTCSSMFIEKPTDSEAKIIKKHVRECQTRTNSKCEK